MLEPRSFIFFPDTEDPGPIAGKVPGARDVEFRAVDGVTLHTWLFTPLEDARSIAVLYLPGNGGNRSGRQATAQAIVARGYTVLLLEYRGYGGNPGTPSEEGFAMDARAAADFLHDQGYPASRIIYVGESIGTGVATRLAAADLPAGVLLRSPFTSMVDMAKALYPLLPADALLRDRYETMRYLPDITVPITVLAGSLDELVPVTQSETVANSAPNLFQFTVVDGVGHNDPIWGSEYLAAQVDALARAVIN